MTIKFVTLGVYGFTEADFFATLLAHGVDTFCDIRLRRGMRGAKYAFVNSTYLQTKLQELGITYVHHKELAPTPEVRRKQQADDKSEKVKKRERQTLSQAFIQAYTEELLAGFDAAAFVGSFGPQANKVALFCVEREPEACHRSLVAQKLADALGIEVEHLTP
jgi:uncharacterized protein (DUF488 family)